MRCRVARRRGVQGHAGAVAAASTDTSFRPGLRSHSAAYRPSRWCSSPVPFLWNSGWVRMLRQRSRRWPSGNRLSPSARRRTRTMSLSRSSVSSILKLPSGSDSSAEVEVVVTGWRQWPRSSPRARLDERHNRGDPEARGRQRADRLMPIVTSGASIFSANSWHAPAAGRSCTPGMASSTMSHSFLLAREVLRQHPLARHVLVAVRALSAFIQSGNLRQVFAVAACASGSWP